MKIVSRVSSILEYRTRSQSKTSPYMRLDSYDIYDMPYTGRYTVDTWHTRSLYYVWQQKYRLLVETCNGKKTYLFIPIYFVDRKCNYIELMHFAFVGKKVCLESLRAGNCILATKLPSTVLLSLLSE